MGDMFDRIYDIIESFEEYENDMKKYELEKIARYPEYATLHELCKSAGKLDDAKKYYAEHKANIDIRYDDDRLFWTCVKNDMIDFADWIFSQEPFDFTMKHGMSIWAQFSSCRLDFLNWIKKIKPDMLKDYFLTYDANYIPNLFFMICINKFPKNLETAKLLHDIIKRELPSLKINFDYTEILLKLSKVPYVTTELLDWIYGFVIDPANSDNLDLSPAMFNVVILSNVFKSSNFTYIKWLYNKNLIYCEHILYHISGYIKQSYNNIDNSEYIECFKWLHEIMYNNFYLENLDNEVKIWEYNQALIKMFYNILNYFTNTDLIEQIARIIINMNLHINSLSSYSINQLIRLNIYNIISNANTYEGDLIDFIKYCHDLCIRLNSPLDFSNDDHSIVKFINRYEDKINEICEFGELGRYIVSIFPAYYIFNGSSILIINKFTDALESGDFTRVIADMEHINYICSDECTTCVVCTMEYSTIMPPLQLQCNHIFCVRCVVYLVENNNSRTCPYCRQNYEFKECKVLVMQPE